ncbi:hypothetical protein [Actinoallomurus sp. CA-142502]|uniref:hypothetical protein n=1 Tax=Actinoallomurus sp. CA-142502 TaxID=3239885 RepID=UPI003D90EF98
MVRRLPQLRQAVADAITHHPANRTGTPEQRHPVSLMLADTVLRVVRPCTCDGDPIECTHETARAQAEARLERVRHRHRGPRTDRHGSGCIGCGLIWPCPTYLDVTEADRG